MENKEIIKKIGEDYVELERYFDSIKDIESYADFPEFKENPFLCLLGDVIKMSWKTKGIENGVGSIEYVDKDSGDVVSAQENRIFRRKEYVDGASFSKIYFTQIKTLFSLSGTALKVYGYIIQKLDGEVNSGKVEFDLKECMDFIELKSRASIYAGLRELIIKGFICKTSMAWIFFVNPLFIFNGNRIVIFNEYIRQDHFKSIELKK